MERDLNHYLSEGYSRGEVLAAVLHSVRENYLNKVAVESAIGDTIVFQGATARNRALVAAFEQRIGKPILVSPYCHLTGALGVALTLRDEGVRSSAFRGLGLHRKRIPLRSETCDLCTNHCKLSVAQVEGDTVAYGFLCGRDYETPGVRPEQHFGVRSCEGAPESIPDAARPNCPGVPSPSASRRPSTSSRTSPSGRSSSTCWGSGPSPASVMGKP